MKKVVILIILASASFALKANGLDTLCNANTNTITNIWSAKYKKSPFGLGLGIQTKYVWRGMEMMSQNSSPVTFPSISYSFNGMCLYVMGGSALNGKYAEVDLGASYTWKGVTIGLNDYYYPTVEGSSDNYFSAGIKGHWLEATLTYAPDRIPVWVTASNFFYGPDKYFDDFGVERQAYSSYLEIGTYYDFLNNNRISLTIGAAMNKSCYNGYMKKFSICNLEVKYTYNVIFKDNLSLPLGVSFIYNPVYNKPFVNFSANITL